MSAELTMNIEVNLNAGGILTQSSAPIEDDVIATFAKANQCLLLAMIGQIQPHVSDIATPDDARKVRIICFHIINKMIQVALFEAGLFKGVEHPAYCLALAMLQSNKLQDTLKIAGAVLDDVRASTLFIDAETFYDVAQTLEDERFRLKETLLFTCCL